MTLDINGDFEVTTFSGMEVNGDGTFANRFSLEVKEFGYINELLED